MNIIYESGAFIDRDAVIKYAYLVNDLNAICFADSIAQQFGYSKAVIPNMLLASYVSTVLTDFYGDGTVQFQFEISYFDPVPVESGIIIQLFDESSETIHCDKLTVVNFNIAEEIIKRRGGVNHSTFIAAAEGKVMIKPGIKNFEKTN